MGVCDNPVSRNYYRGVLGEAAACENFAINLENVEPSSGRPEVKNEVYAGISDLSKTPSALKCSDCHYWLPVDYLNYLVSVQTPHPST